MDSWDQRNDIILPPACLIYIYIVVLKTDLLRSPWSLQTLSPCPSHTRQDTRYGSEHKALFCGTSFKDPWLVKEPLKGDRFQAQEMSNHDKSVEILSLPSFPQANCQPTPTSPEMLSLLKGSDQGMGTYSQLASLQPELTQDRTLVSSSSVTGCLSYTSWPQK